MANKYGNHGIRFTEYQKQFMIEHYSDMDVCDISKAIGLTEVQIRNYCNPRKIKPYRVGLFTEAEKQYITDNYLTMTYKEIAEALGKYTEKQIRGWIVNNLPRKYRSFNDTYFEEIDAPDKAYWLGFIYADGWISSHKRSSTTSSSNCGDNYELGIELQRTDEYHLQTFNEALGGVHTIKQLDHNRVILDNKAPSVTQSSVLRIYSKHIVEDLLRHGIDYRKSNTNSIPKVSDELFPDFLRGYIDGDGCLYVDQKNHMFVHITSANKDGLEYLQCRLRELYDIDTRIYKHGENTHRLMCFAKDDVRRLLDVIYYAQTQVRLKRKYEIYQNYYGLAA